MTFGFHGIWQGVAVLYDKQSGSKWLHMTGECIEGPLKGETLKPVSGRHVTWKEWKRDHPDTDVFVADGRLLHKYMSRSERRGSDFFPQKFLPTIQTRDSRLPMTALCYGITSDGTARAYPFRELALLDSGVANDRVGKSPVAVVFDRKTNSATAWERRIDGETLVLERTADGLLRDRASRSQFNLEGEGVSGRYRGQRLPRVFGLQSEWYGWFATYPQTSIWRAAPERAGQ